MSNIPYDDALLIMNVIKACSEHGNAASAIASVAMADLAEINEAAAEELKEAQASKAEEAAAAAGQTGNIDLPEDPEPKPKEEPIEKKLPQSDRRA